MNSTLTRRRFLQASSAVGVSLVGGVARASVSPNGQIGLGIIGLGWRGSQLARLFASQPDVRLAALCDVDRDRLNAVADEHAVERRVTAYEDLLDDPSIDAVVIATCNHWHCLAAIHACQAGKDVYVEKPLGHDLWEQQQLVAAAHRYKRIVQVGTQQRSDPMQDEVRQFLHTERALGDLKGAVACRLGARKPIGRRSDPLSLPSSVDTDRWFGPAKPKPLFRDQLHYDWHWDWGTGNGEMGNWGVHVLDDVRNLVLNDTVGLPTAVAGFGARVGWEDAGQTPNLHVSLFETSNLPIACVTNNVEPPKGEKPPRLGGVQAGYVVYCEGGRYEGRRAGGAAFDTSGKRIRKFKGDSGELAHCRNFLDAIHQRDPSLLNAPVEVGHLSSAWCHYGNAAYLSGGPSNPGLLTSLAGETQPWAETIESARRWMKACGYPIDKAPFVAADWQAIDSETGRFTGDMADAVQPVFRSDYREGYQVPKITPT